MTLWCSKENIWFSISLFFIRIAQRMKFSIKDFFSKCDQIHRNLQNWSHLLKKSLMENFIFCAVSSVATEQNRLNVMSWPIIRSDQLTGFTINLTLFLIKLRILQLILLILFSLVEGCTGLIKIDSKHFPYSEIDF